MTVSWSGAIGSALGICIFLGPFAYKDRRAKGGSHFRAILDVGLVFVLLVLWIAGGSNALYGMGIIIDEPPQILGSGGYDPGRSHLEHVRVPHVVLGVILMAAAWGIGRLAELRR
jgi:hypothetical protein